MHDHYKLWFFTPKPRSQPESRLFCFPCAGGVPVAYHPWPSLLPPQVEVCVLNLPGRGKRLNEAAFTRLSPLVDTLFPILEPALDVPFAFLGHSLGAVLAFELTRLLRRRGYPLPEHLFVCACHAPHYPIIKPSICKLPEGAFIAELVNRYDAIPQAILEDGEMMKLFLPTLRADFTLLETYQYQPEPPLDCPIVAFGGEDDRVVSQEKLRAWQEHSQTSFSWEMLPGDHFFLHNQRQFFLQRLSTYLAP